MLPQFLSKRLKVHTARVMITLCGCSSGRFLLFPQNGTDNFTELQ
jgi:hypothetical protein